MTCSRDCSEMHTFVPPCEQAICPVTGKVPLGPGCTGDMTCQVHHPRDTFRRLGSVYAPGSLYAVAVLDGQEWHLAAYSGEAFYAAASDRDYPRTWQPIEIDRAVLVTGGSTPTVAEAPAGNAQPS